DAAGGIGSDGGHPLGDLVDPVEVDLGDVEGANRVTDRVVELVIAESTVIVGRQGVSAELRIAIEVVRGVVNCRIDGSRRGEAGLPAAESGRGGDVALAVVDREELRVGVAVPRRSEDAAQ